MYARYTYDGIGERKHIFELASFGDQPEERLEILELAKLGKVYVTNIDSRKCYVFNMNRPFHRHDIPTGASFEGVS